MPGMVPTSRAMKWRSQSTAESVDAGIAPSEPTFMERRSLRRIALRLSDGDGGALSGKMSSTRESRSSLPSSTRKPMAVEVKLLECE